MKANIVQQKEWVGDTDNHLGKVVTEAILQVVLIGELIDVQSSVKDFPSTVNVDSETT